MDINKSLGLPGRRPVLRSAVIVLTVIAAVLAAGCAPLMPSDNRYPAPSEDIEDINKPQPRSPASLEPASIEPAAPKPSAARLAVGQLLAEGWQLHRQGAYERSNAVAERAMRLDRLEAEIYLLLATNYFQLWNLDAAEQLARQGLPLSSAQSDTKQRLQYLLAQILSKK